MSVLVCFGQKSQQKIILLKTCSSVKPDFILAPCWRTDRGGICPKHLDHHLLETRQGGCHIIFGSDVLSKPTCHDGILFHFKPEPFPSRVGEEPQCPGLEQPGTAQRGLLLPCALAAGPAALPWQLHTHPPPTFSEHIFL